MTLESALFLLVAWLIGGIPFGYMAGRTKGIDIREHGSGNIGATNVVRVCGKPLGIACFICDAAKGFLPVFAASRLVAGEPGQWPHWLPAITVIITVSGHIWTPFLRFRGGKGIATSAGALAGIALTPITVAFVIWVIVFYLSRYVSLASICGAAALPIMGLILRFAAPAPWNDVSNATLALLTIVGLLAIIRHRSNISRLMAGTENRFERKRKDKTTP